PNVAASAGADQGGVPKLLMQRDGILARITALPFIQDGQVAPGKTLLRRTELIAEKGFENRYEAMIDAQAEVCAQPGIDRNTVGLDAIFVTKLRVLTVESAFQHGFAQSEHERIRSDRIIGREI